jgi:V8-like Glu-specific endopeptidase
LVAVIEGSANRTQEELSFQNFPDFIKGESMTINSTQEEFIETAGETPHETTVTNPSHKSTGVCPPAVYVGEKKRARSPQDGPFTHEKSPASEWPNKVVGKIVFTRPTGERATCSGAVIQKRLVVTAGHCTYKNGNYMSDFLFIPAFDDGVAPYGIWSFKQVWISPTWLSNSRVPNEGDWAIFVVKDKMIGGKQTSIGDCLGWFGFATNNLVDNHVTSLGYADNFDLGGKMHQVYSQYRRNRTSHIVEYPSDMTEGTSGGPWVENFGSEGDDQNRVVGVTSYRDADSSRRYLGSSIMNSKFVELFSSACRDTEGNCQLPE